MGFGPTGSGLGSPAFQQREDPGLKDKLMQILPLLLAGGAGAAFGGGQGFGAATQSFQQNQLIQDQIAREEQGRLRRQQSEERDREMALALQRLEGDQGIGLERERTKGTLEVQGEGFKGQKGLMRTQEQIDRGARKEEFAQAKELSQMDIDSAERIVGRKLTADEENLLEEFKFRREQNQADRTLAQGEGAANRASRERLGEMGIQADKDMQQSRITAQAAMPQQGQQTDYRLLAQTADNPQDKQALTQKADSSDFLDLQNQLGKAIIADDIAAVEQAVNKIRSSPIPEDMKVMLIQAAEQYLNPPEEEGDPTSIGGAIEQAFPSGWPTPVRR